MTSETQYTTSDAASPQDFDVVIEIPAFSTPIKYELDERMGLLRVDRYLEGNLVFPVNYGFIADTESGDASHLDAMVMSPFPLLAHCILRCRALGVLRMEDEEGGDQKILAAPAYRLCPELASTADLADVDSPLLDRLQHFFKTYKRVDPARWSRVFDWEDKECAEQLIGDAMITYHTRRNR
ncbi:inorganic diphosphatase [Paraburkholderia tropica]|uniref:inorganic diphosphatase n=1 Tax=Paraburkholderia tropica TaxID=92647 RepID=UPI002AB7C5D6|nr:inorganic diphosphatase [Paraburkholderia tropica]